MNAQIAVCHSSTLEWRFLVDFFFLEWSFSLHSFQSIKLRNLLNFLQYIVYVCLCVILDADYVQVVHEKLYNLYTRIKKSQDNIDIVLDSIQVWDLTPSPPHRREDNHVSHVLDTDGETRDLKCRDRDTEVNNSKKLIAFIVEENYRLLFGLPSLERRKEEFGIGRLRSTIIRKFGRHQAKATIERMSSVVHKWNDRKKRQINPNINVNKVLFVSGSNVPDGFSRAESNTNWEY